MDKLKNIRKIIKEKFEDNDWKYHILSVIKYAKKLAKIYEADEKLVELAALMHDIGRIDIKNDGEHHILGVPKAEKILKEQGYSEDVIKIVSHCVESHRIDKGPKPETIIAKIIANADAMAHFDAMPVFFYWKGERGENFEEILKWVDAKVEKDWNKKITFPEAKEMVRKKYEATKSILESLKECQENPNN